VIVGKTGYTVEAGRSLIFRAQLGARLVDIVLLGAREMASVFGDAGRIRRYLEDKYDLGSQASVR
jgi:D-alanyl-D-alanine carboxypeptidase